MNGIIISRLMYLIPMWGGHVTNTWPKFKPLWTTVQDLFLGRGTRTKTLELMVHCNWMTVKEMAELYTLIAMFRIVKMGIPEYVGDKINMDQDNLVFTSRHRIQNSADNFRWRGVTSWNTMPPHLRQINKISQFKTQVKIWLKEKRTPSPDWCSQWWLMTGVGWYAYWTTYVSDTLMTDLKILPHLAKQG